MMVEMGFETAKKYSIDRPGQKIFWIAYNDMFKNYVSVWSKDGLFQCSESSCPLLWNKYVYSVSPRQS